MPEQPWFLYVLECEGGRLYTGISPDVRARFDKHKSGKGAMFTRLNHPKRILGCLQYPDKRIACQAEYALKKLDRQTKLLWAVQNPWKAE